MVIFASEILLKVTNFKYLITDLKKKKYKKWVLHEVLPPEQLE